MAWKKKRLTFAKANVDNDPNAFIFVDECMTLCLTDSHRRTIVPWGILSHTCFVASMGSKIFCGRLLISLTINGHNFSMGLRAGPLAVQRIAPTLFS